MEDAIQELINNERTILTARLSAWPFAGLGGASSIAALIGKSLIGNGFLVTGAILIITALLQIVFGFLIFRTTSALLTTHRIIRMNGIFQRNLKEIELLDIVSIAVTQSVVGWIFGFGSLSFSIASSERIKIANITGPWMFRRKCLEAKRAVK